MAKIKKSNTILKYNDKQLRHLFPAWVVIIYGAACCILIPWTSLLAIVLPRHYVSQHWRATWTGFDLFECSLFALTALLALKRSSWTAISSAMLGTVLIMDAWFDVLTSSTGHDQHAAIVEAIFIELPLAFISLLLSLHIFNYFRHNHLRS